MHEVFYFLMALVVILTAAKVFGEIAVRFGQSAIVGELLAGVVIAPLFFKFIAQAPNLETVLLNMSELGAIILLFEVGLSTDIREFIKSGKWALAVALVGVILPYFFGYYTFLYFGKTATQAIFAGAVLTATSVGITARVFRDLKKLDTEEAKIVLGAAVIDDIIGLTILAVVLKLVSGAAITFSSVSQIAGTAILFFVLSIAAGLLIAPTIFKLISKMKQEKVVFIFGLAFCLLIAALSSQFGLAPIVGAFAAGLILARTLSGPKIKRDLKPISAFFVPIFFVLMGANVELDIFNPFVAENRPLLLLAAVLFIVAFVGKASAGFVVAKKGINRLLIGASMVPRGEVGLIFASMGYKVGQFSKGEYSALVAVIMLTTFVTPFVLKYLISRDSRKRKGEIQSNI